MTELFDSRFVTSSDVLTRHVDGELVVLNLENERFFGLDSVGTRIWEVLTSSPSIEAGVGKLLSEFDVDPDRLRGDVQTLVTALVADGLGKIEAE